MIDRAYKRINRSLALSVVEVHGNVIHLDQDDSMGLAIDGVYEPLETSLVLAHIQPGFHILDIGANIGYYTLLFAQLVGPSGHVFAFEPDPISFDLLSKNIAANGYQNISAFQMAVTDRDSELPLYRDKFNNLDHRIIKPPIAGSSIMVRAVRLDTFLPQVSDRQINFVKMDIQGSEGLALKGMVRLVSQMKTVYILTEYWPTALNQSGYGAERYLRKLIALGYEIYDISTKSDLSHPATVDELIKRYPLESAGQTNLLCRRLS